MRFPDFIIIGAMKSATTTLADQLAFQDGINITIPKEPNYFSDDDVYSNGEQWYSALFEKFPATELQGEASTHYTKLPIYSDTISRMQACLPGTVKYIYVMRHPVDRLVSHYIHEWSMNNYKCDIDTAIKQYPELHQYGCYALQIEPYINTFGKEQILPVFFDSLIKKPQQELERICSFIGYKGTPAWVTEANANNVSNKRIRKFPFYELLIESSVATFFRRNFIPKSLRRAVKDRLRMKTRPEISSQSLQYIEHIFNEDLVKLGGWLGVDLNCKNFKAVTSQKPLEWVIPRGD